MNNAEKEFLGLVEKHSGIIHKISKMYMESLEDREDLFQEIILQLWKSYKTFRAQSAFSTWMYTIALNTAITFLKHDNRKKRSQVLVIWQESAEDPFGENKNDQLQRFYKAAQSLNPIEKALVFLFLEGQPYKEIALRLGITEVNARVKLNRTKEKLQNIIKQQENEH